MCLIIKLRNKCFELQENYRAIMHLLRYAAVQSLIHHMLQEEVRSLMFCFFSLPPLKKALRKPHNRQVWNYANDYFIF